LSFYKAWASYRCDENVRAARNFSEIARARMDHRHRRVAALAFVHEQKRERLANDHAAANHDDVRSGDLDSAFDQQPLTTERRARHKSSRIAERELRDVRRVKTIHVLLWIDCVDDD